MFCEKKKDSDFLNNIYIQGFIRGYYLRYRR